VDTVLNKEERSALISFLLIYVFSAMVLVVIIGVLYYKKEMASIKEKCLIEMSKKAMWIEKELMHSHMEHKKYIFNPKSNRLRVGLFDANKNPIYSNLKSKSINFNNKFYKNNNYEFYIDRLEEPLLGVYYIVIEGNQFLGEKTKLIFLIGSVALASLFFIALIGYFLSKLLIAPIKSRVDKLNSFLKDSAHDINTPVSALLMSVSSLKNSDKVDKKVLNHIAISSKLISQIYNSLSFIAFNDKDEIFNEKFDLKDAVLDSIKFFEEIANLKGNEIVYELESTYVFMDKYRIQQVLNNLLSNALKYSYPKTKIEIKLKDRTLSIKDEGIGIKEADKDKIFDRFERGSSLSGGFGIGLDIVKSICKSYNIGIKIDSKLSKGSTFYLSF